MIHAHIGRNGSPNSAILGKFYLLLPSLHLPPPEHEEYAIVSRSHDLFHPSSFCPPAHIPICHERLPAIDGARSQLLVLFSNLCVVPATLRSRSPLHRVHVDGVDQEPPAGPGRLTFWDLGADDLQRDRLS
jgi:hypothetical protein